MPPSSSSSNPGPSPDPEEQQLSLPVPLPFWLMVGGAGPPPPTRSGLLRMASERKAAHREREDWRRRRADALAEFERQWGGGLTTCRRRIPGRRELVERFKPGGTEREKGKGKGVGGGGREEKMDGIEDTAGD